MSGLKLGDVLSTSYFPITGDNTGGYQNRTIIVIKAVGNDILCLGITRTIKSAPYSNYKIAITQNPNYKVTNTYLDQNKKVKDVIDMNNYLTCNFGLEFEPSFVYWHQLVTVNSLLEEKDDNGDIIKNTGWEDEQNHWGLNNNSILKLKSLLKNYFN